MWPSVFERTMKAVNSYVSSGISLILNFLLIVVVLKNTSNQMKTGKKILMTSPTADIVMSISTILFQPTLFVHDGYYYLAGEGLINRMSTDQTILASSVYATSIYWSLTAVPPQYLARAALICWNKEFTNAEYFLIVFIFFLLAVGYGLYFSTGLAACLPRLPKNVTASFQTPEWQRSDGTFTAFGICAVEDMKAVPYWYLGFVSFIFLVITVASLLICFHFHKFQKNLQEKTRKMQRKMNLVLFIQAIFPFISIGFPLLLDSAAIWMGWSFPFAGILCMFLSAWSPIFNAILVFAFFEQYRQGICRLCCKKSKDSTVMALSTNVM